jgi:Spy/CpxP family protein refolding chaperone
MRKSRNLLAAAAILVCAAAVAPACAQEGPEGPPEMAPPGGAMPVPPGDDVLFTIEAPPLFGGIEETDMLEASMVPSSEVFLAALPETAAPVLLADAGRGGRGMWGLPKELQLTDDQWERLYQIGKESNDKAAPKMSEMRQAMSSLRDAMMAVDVDKSKASAAQSKVNSLHADLANIKLDKKIAMLSVLTAEQRQELHNRFLKMAVMRDFMGGHRRGGMMLRRGHHRRGGGHCPVSGMPAPGAGPGPGPGPGPQ